MTLVRRATKDMFAYAKTADFMVNPVNLVKTMGAGIAKEFKDRHPHMFDLYVAACDSEKLRVGTIQVVDDPEVNYKIINLPTKRHWVDESKVEEITKGLKALQRFLSLPENKSAHVVMPMLGCGCGKLGYDAVEPAFIEYLDGLDAVVSLCMHPDKLGYTPKYVGIIGPRCFADITSIGKPQPNGTIYTEEQYQQERAYVEDALLKACAGWGIAPSDFDAFVSGGARGVDTVACGTSADDPSYLESLAKKYSAARPVICHVNWDRYQLAAGMIRNRLVVDIVTHLVVIRPHDVASIGTTAALRLALRNNIAHPLGDPGHKYIYVAGDADVDVRSTAIKTHM